MLYRLKSPPLFSVRNVRHRRHPIFTKETRRLSYKIYDEELFRKVLEEQSIIATNVKALFHNHSEVADIAEMDADDALAMTRERAKKNAQRVGRPTSKSSIEIGHGEERCTREVEFIWWPTLYSEASRNGKLSVRFYLKKVSI